jgi:hypothetical protein
LLYPLGKSKEIISNLKVPQVILRNKNHYPGIEGDFFRACLEEPPDLRVPYIRNVKKAINPRVKGQSPFTLEIKNNKGSAKCTQIILAGKEL